jgi:ABC-2 type transport system permease protein
MTSAETTVAQRGPISRTAPLPVWVTLVRHHLRLIAPSSAAWIVGLVAMATLVAAAYATTMPTLEDRQALARSVEGNPAFEALFGRAIALDTIEGFTMWRAGGPLVPAIVIWGLVVATRLARGAEDKGQDELLMSGAFSRRALLASIYAALAVVMSIYAVLTATMLLLASDISGAGAWRFALAMAGAFAFFASLGTVLVQITPHRSAALRIGLGLVGAALAARILAVLEALPTWLRWTTPFGWFSEIGSPAVGSNAPFMLLGAGTLLFGAVAIVLVQRRELHGSLLLQERDTIHQRRPYTSLPAHALRQGLPALTGFACVGLLLALLFGLVANDFVRFIEDFPTFQALLRDFGLTRPDDPSAFIGLILSVLVIIVTLYAAGHVAALREDEATGRLATLLILPLERRRWLGLHAAVGLLGIVLVSLLIGLGAMLGTAVTGTMLAPLNAVRAGLNLIPIGILFLGLGLLVFGVYPPLTGPLVYAVLLVSFLVVLMDALLDIPGWFVTVSPFDHLAMAPGEPINATSSIVFLLLGVTGAIIGALAFRRRDLLMD